MGMLGIHGKTVERSVIETPSCQINIMPITSQAITDTDDEIDIFKKIFRGPYFPLSDYSKDSVMWLFVYND